MSGTVCFTFRGALDDASFRAFAAHRAARLDLGIVFARPVPGEVSVAVTGDDELAGAFEMACSLGPMNCLVEDIVRDTSMEGLAWVQQAGTR